MDDFLSKTLESLFGDLLLVLHYLLPPVVGILVIWFASENRAFETSVQLLLGFHHWSWLGALVFVASGFLVYHVHRSILHVPFGFVAMSLWRCSFKTPTLIDLEFARWIRRSARLGTPTRSVQSALDHANAGVHFLYCSCWASFLWRVILLAHPETSLQIRDYWFWWSTIVLLAVAFAGELWTANRDLGAFRRFAGT